MANEPTDGEISDGSVSLISGTEFEMRHHVTPISSLPPSPPASPPQPFWMRAHIPDVADLAPMPSSERDSDIDQPAPPSHAFNGEPIGVIRRPVKRMSLSQLAEIEWNKKLALCDSESEADKRRELGLEESASADQDSSNETPNVFNLIMYGLAGLCVLLFTILIAHLFSSWARINHLRSVIHTLEGENIKLQHRYSECRKVELAYNAQKQATDAAAAAALADMQLNANDAISEYDATFKQIPQLQEVPMGRKVWTSDGFVLETAHLPPKKHFKYEELCDKEIPDDLFSDYTSSYCEKVRENKRNAEARKRPPMHTHQQHRGTALHQDKPIFVEDFIDPNKFNSNTLLNDQNDEFKQINRLIGSANVDSGFEDDEEFEYKLHEPVVAHAINMHEIVPKGYDSFEDALLKLDEHMERISFHTNSCHTKYKKLKEDEERKAVKKLEKPKMDKMRKKQKEYYPEMLEKKEKKDKKEKRREEKHDDKRDERRDDKRREEKLKKREQREQRKYEKSERKDNKRN